MFLTNEELYTQIQRNSIAKARHRLRVAKANIQRISNESNALMNEKVITEKDVTIFGIVMTAIFLFGSFGLQF